MKRIIKFRAWSGEQMLKHIEFFETPEGFIWADSICKIGVRAIMQFTGLIDKNFKEIYEGDIIKGLLTLENNDNYDFVDVVSYRAPHFWCATSADFDLEQYDSLEVIGNIYENPELIK